MQRARSVLVLYWLSTTGVVVLYYYSKVPTYGNACTAPFPSAAAVLLRAAVGSSYCPLRLIPVGATHQTRIRDPVG